MGSRARGPVGGARYHHGGMRRRLRPIVLLAAAMTSACAGGSADDSARPTTTTVATTTTSTTVIASTAPPTSAATTVAEPPPFAAPSCPPIPARVAPPPDRPRYQLRIDVRPADNVVEGEVKVRFIPDLPTDRLVFRLWPNGPRAARVGARLDVGAVSIDGAAADARVDEATTLVVRRGGGGSLAAGRPVDVAVAWRLTLPGPVNDRISRSGDAVRLGSFFPILAWEPGVGWATDPPTSGFAEASTAAAADFTATVTVPTGLGVMATGVTDGNGRWTASNVGDFALSVGRFTTATATANAPQPVQVAVGVHEGTGGAPGDYLPRVVRSIEDMARRYGAYPWPSYSLAITPALSGGIEYPMHVFQGPGTTTRTTPHEVAHMWFYGLVANNQGRDPWLDEGLASFAEARFDNTLSAFKARSIPAVGRNRTGESMAFWESRSAAYYRSVYTQGAQALAALGDPELVDCVLAQYVARHAYQVARPADFIAAASAVFPDAPATLAHYGIR